MKKLGLIPSGKIIRDAVHGDIFLPDKFLKIVDTSEFQRLRRIRQLSTAYLIFPTAEHNRFSHSLGTFYIMRELINYFRPIFDDINIKFSDREINLALSAALLHDIGHGPFSHAFENALPEYNKKTHEDWTIDIISSDDSDIKKVLRQEFDYRFPEDLVNLIKKEREIKTNQLVISHDDIDLFFVLSSLISSQLDADRIDYLLRDAYFTGVSYGSIDISRVINALTITVYNNKYYVCVKEKYLSSVEEYLLARYQMHEEVYLHSFKYEMELLVQKILNRVFELLKNNIIQKDEVPEALFAVYNNDKLTIKEYINLDDTILISSFIKWKNNKDTVLSTLCKCFLDREKYKKLEILNNTKENFEDFKKELLDIFKKNEYSFDLDRNYFWLEGMVANRIYKDKKENIWVLKNNGTICDLFEISKLVTNSVYSEKRFAYINMELLEKMNVKKETIEDINNLVKLYNNRNHIEIEKKYFIQDKIIFSEVLKRLGSLEGYTIDEKKEVIQEDYYFDTTDYFLSKSNKTLRFRNKNNKVYLTIKTPTREAKFSEEGMEQSERFEYEIEVKQADINDNLEEIIKYVPELKNKLPELVKTLTIKNKRKIYELKCRNILFEICFDDVIYQADTKEVKDYQIEIELKSEYLHRVNLKIISDYLENKIPDLITTTMSKYKKGLELINKNI